MMRLLSQAAVTICLTFMFCTSLPTLALSTDRTVYDKPDVRSGKIVRGDVMNVDEKSSQSWNVSVKDRETGKVVVLHIDKSTTRKSISLRPELGAYVIAQYNEQDNHAYSFLTNEREHN